MSIAESSILLHKIAKAVFSSQKKFLSLLDDALAAALIIESTKTKADTSNLPNSIYLNLTSR